MAAPVAAPAIAAAAAPPQPSAQIFRSKRGGEKLALQGFIFNHRHTAKDGTKLWICDRQPCLHCTSTVKTKPLGDNLTVSNHGQHNHLPNPEHASVEIMKGALRAAAVSDAGSSASVLVANALQPLDRPDMDVAPANDLLKRVVWSARQSDQKKRLRLNPEEPQVVQTAPLSELILPPQLCEVNGDSFLLHDDGVAFGKDRIMMFGCAHNLEVLEKAETWLGDGTFRIAPPQYKQVYTVHGSLCGFTIPCIYICLPDKKKTTYKRAFAKVVELVFPHGVTYAESPTVLIDFEQAAIIAWQESLAEDCAAGCYFHFRQAVLRHVQSLGFISRYSESQEFRKRVGKLGALAFLKPEDVPTHFDHIAQEFLEDEKPILEYFEKTWVGKKTRQGRKAPMFAIELWSTHSRAANKAWLTTNNAELFHRHHRANITSHATHPPFLAFLESLHKQQTLVNNDCAKIGLGYHGIGTRRPANLIIICDHPSVQEFAYRCGHWLPLRSHFDHKFEFKSRCWAKNRIT